jgi:hypothetical protein
MTVLLMEQGSGRRHNPRRKGVTLEGLRTLPQKSGRSAALELKCLYTFSRAPRSAKSKYAPWIVTNFVETKEDYRKKDDAVTLSAHTSTALSTR